MTVTRTSSTRRSIRVMLVDDHPVVREGCRHLLESTPDIRVVAEAGDGRSACELYARNLPDVVVLDLALPDVNGPKAIELLKSRYADMRIVVFSMYESEALERQARESGAAAYLNKSSDIGQLREAVRAAARTH